VRLTLLVERGKIKLIKPDSLKVFLGKEWIGLPVGAEQDSVTHYHRGHIIRRGTDF